MSHYTIKHKIPGIAFNHLVKTDAKGNTAWMMEPDGWGFDWDRDYYFSTKEIESFEPVLRSFVQSEFCEVIKA